MKLFKLGNDSGIAVNLQLRKLWRQVVENYESKDLHKKFLKSCQKQGHLDFCSYCYGRILDACPTDDQAIQMKKQILALTQAAVSPQPESEPKRESFLRSFLNLKNFLMLGAASLFFIGYFVPTGRNLSGLGAALMFLLIALRIYSRRQSV